MYPTSFSTLISPDLRAVCYSSSGRLNCGKPAFAILMRARLNPCLNRSSLFLVRLGCKPVYRRRNKYLLSRSRVSLRHKVSERAEVPSREGVSRDPEVLARVAVAAFPSPSVLSTPLPGWYFGLPLSYWRVSSAPRLLPATSSPPLDGLQERSRWRRCCDIIAHS